MLDQSVSWTKISGEQVYESIISLLSMGGWFFSDEIESRFRQTPWVVLDKLVALQANDRLVSVRIPGSRQFLWHKATRQLLKVAEAKKNTDVSSLPSFMRKELAKKLKSDPIPIFDPWGTQKRWDLAVTSVERHLMLTGSANIRVRPDMDFHYKCAWDMFAENKFYMPSAQKFYFQIGFIGGSKVRLETPPATERERQTTTETTWWSEPGDRKCLVATDKWGTRLWLSGVDQLTFDERTGQVTAPSPDELAERTNLMILQGSETLPGIVAFAQIQSCRIQLLSRKGKTARAPKRLHATSADEA